MKGMTFTGESVRGIAAGIKTQTRRVIKPQYAEKSTGEIVQFEDFISEYGMANFIKFAKYQPGDIVYVQETWRYIDFSYIDGDVSASVQYKDGTIGPRLHYLKKGMDERRGWRSPKYMPESAARYFLRITGVRAERVQEISEADAKAEGIRSYWWSEPLRNDAPFIGVSTTPGCSLCLTRREAFMQIWESIHAKDGFGWTANPYVWVDEFEKIEKESQGK